MFLTSAIKLFYLTHILILYAYALTYNDISIENFTISKTLCSIKKSPKLNSLVISILSGAILLQFIYYGMLFKTRKIVSILSIILLLSFAYFAYQVLNTNCISDEETKNQHYLYASLLVTNLWLQCCLNGSTTFSVTFGITLLAYIMYVSKYQDNLTVVSIFEILFFLQFLLC